MGLLSLDQYLLPAAVLLRTTLRLDFSALFAYSRGMTDGIRTLPQAFAKYVVAGGAAFCLDYALLRFCHSVLGFHYLAATAIGFGGGVICTYLCCNLWVFSRRKMKGHVEKEFGIFVLIGLIGMALTLLLMGFFVDVLALSPYISKIFTSVLVLMWNFSARKMALY